MVFFAGLLYASLLYVKNRNNKLSSGVSVLLFCFRFISISFLTFLLLSPYIKTRNKYIEKPIVIVGHDNSSSILMGKDSLYYQGEFKESLVSFLDELEGKFEVDSYLFGDKVVGLVDVNYGDQMSNYSDFFNHIRDNYNGLNVGAVVLIGDGIVNNGLDPVTAASELNYPIFTVAMGDTIQSKDLKIDDVRHNSIVYSGDTFPIEVNISANSLKGDASKIRLYENNAEVQYKGFKIDGDIYNNSFVFNVLASTKGKRRFEIVIDGVEDEKVLDNNSRNIFVDVLDSKKRILILANAPHPDIGAIKQSLDTNPNLEVEIDYLTGYQKNINEFDLVILHQLPSITNSAPRVLRSLIDNEIPTLYVLGNQSRLSVFNRFYDGLNINSATGSTTGAQFEANKQFSLFSFNTSLENQLQVFPPLSVPMGNYRLAEGSEIFGWQKILDLTTEFPLISFYDKTGVRSGVIVGEGLWQWRIQNYINFNDFDAVNALINKSVMYLIADVDKRRFKVITQGEYDTRYDITLDAELYNKSLELDNKPEVLLTLFNENNEQFSFVFSPYEDFYTINLNKLPVGIYTYKATVKQGNNIYIDRGEFVVKQIDNESYFLNADHRMLNRLAYNHNGKMYYPNQINELNKEISEMEDIVSKIHYQDKFIGINSLVYIMLGLILLLSVEWFLRKYYGSY